MVEKGKRLHNSKKITIIHNFIFSALPTEKQEQYIHVKQNIALNYHFR